MPAYEIKESTIRNLVRNYVDPLFTKLQERLYGSGVSYNTFISKTSLPGDVIYEGDLNSKVGALGYIKGIKTYLAGVLTASDQKELSFSSAFTVSSLGDRTSIGLNNTTTGSGVARIIAGWYLEDAPTVGSGSGPVYQIDANVTISGIWGNTKYSVATGLHTFDVGWSTDLVTWASIFSVKPTLPSGSRVFTHGTLSKTTFDRDDFIRFDVVSLPGTVSSGITAQLRVIGR